MDEDIKLMLELKAGQRAAFDKILDKYEKSIVNYIYRFTGSKEDAEDLAQDTFIKVYNAAAKYTPSAKFTTWLYRIASNVSIDYLRKRKKLINTSSLDEQFETEQGTIKKEIADIREGSVLEKVEKEEKNNEIQKALLALPVNQRSAIVLKIYEDKPYIDIAVIMGISVSSVESLIFRARQALKDRLKR
ncbi:MAG: RNA polymerase sigma factor [bacterium]